MTIVLNITEDTFNSTTASRYDAFFESDCFIDSDSVRVFIKNVIRKYSDYGEIEPTFDQIAEGILFLLKGITPKDEMIKIAFNNWLKQNTENNPAHVVDIRKSLEAFYEALLINASSKE